MFLYNLVEQLEELIEKWENVPYTGDYTKAAKSVCAKELREVLGSPTKHVADQLRCEYCGRGLVKDGEFYCDVGCAEAAGS